MAVGGVGLPVCPRAAGAQRAAGEGGQLCNMQIQELLQSVVTQAGARNVYGDPVSAEGRTILPVAQIRYGFGGGSGRHAGDKQGEGGGGGGGLVAKPVGVVEITAAGSRFIPIGEKRKLAAAVGMGICLGLLIAKARSRCAS